MPYQWRNLSPCKREEILQYRQRLKRPWHRPPHYQHGNVHYHFTAACYDHLPHIGINPERMAEFSEQVLVVFSDTPSALCVLPNHYHVLARSPDVRKTIAALGRLHGVTSFQWNGEESSRRRKVWYTAADRGIRGSDHFWATVNYLHHNPVKHGYVENWSDCPFSSASDFLEDVGRNVAVDLWKNHPVLDYGKGWDDDH